MAIKKTITTKRLDEITNATFLILAEIKDIRTMVESIPVLAIAQEAVLLECRERGYFGRVSPRRVAWCADCLNFTFECEHIISVGKKGRAQKK